MIGATIAEAFSWAFSSALFLVMPPAAGAIFLAVWTWAFVWRLMYRPSVRRASREEVGLRRIGPSVPWLAAAIVAGFVMYLAFVVASDRLFPHRLPDTDYFAMYRARPWGWVPIAILVAVAGPLMEEFIFRGAVQHALIRRFGPAIGITGASLLFAISHFRPQQIGDFFVFGAVSGLLVYRTRSLFAGIAMHSTFNASLLLMSTRPDLPFVGDDHRSTPFWGCVAIALIAALAFFALLSRIRSAPVPAPAPRDANAGTAAQAPSVTAG
jgi:membrane protease YdiL (CAAX protease family)